MPKLGRAVGEAARSAVRLDRSKVSPDVGLRAALGVALTLVVGRATGHTVAGVTATIGALSAGMASHQGTYRSRAAVVVAAGAGMGLSAFIGATVGHLVGPDIAVTAAVGFVAALMVCLGPAGGVVGIQAVVGLVVFSQFSFPVAVAARDGGLVLLGGVVQALLVVVLWPLRRFPAERRAIGDAYARLAGFCRSALAGGPALLDPGALDALEQVMRDAQPFGGDEAAAHQVLAGQADRIRLELVALSRARQRFDAAGTVGVAAPIDDLFAASAQVLEEISAAVRAGSVPSGWEESRNRFEAALAELRAVGADSRAAGADSRPAGGDAAATGGPAAGGGIAALAAVEAGRRADALAGQMRTALRAASAWAGADPAAAENLALLGDAAAVPAGRRSGMVWARETVATLRSNLTFTSQAFRHAVRMAVTLAVAVAVSHAFAFQHRYWLPMTAMLILRPDFSSTVTRGVSRVVGTLIGAGVVTVILAELKPGPDWLIALVIVLCFPATTLVLANYAVYSVCIASLVVTLLAFTGNPELSTAGDRSFYTAAGAILAFAAYGLWPTWEATSLSDTLAGLVSTESRYAGQVLRAWADPDGADRSALQRSRLDARLARSNAEAAVARWQSEPRHPGGAAGGPVLAPAVVTGCMGAVRALVQAVLALHAELPESGPARPEVADLAAQVEQALLAVSDRVKGSPPAASLPSLRARQVALATALGFGGSGSPNQDRLPAGPGLVLAGETDLLVNSINTLGHLVGLEPG